MQSTKSSIQKIAIDFFIRVVSASACIVILILFLWGLRGAVSDVPFERIRSDDPIWLALFLSFWCLIPTIPSYIIELIKNEKYKKYTYIISAIIQSIALYFFVGFISQQPNSEVQSSIFPMLVWIALPLAALYYPMFFYDLKKKNIRIKLIIFTLFLLLFWFI